MEVCDCNSLTVNLAILTGSGKREEDEPSGRSNMSSIIFHEKSALSGSIASQNCFATGSNREDSRRDSFLASVGGLLGS